MLDLQALEAVFARCVCAAWRALLVAKCAAVKRQLTVLLKMLLEWQALNKANALCFLSRAGGWV